MPNQTEKFRRLIDSLPLGKELKDFWCAALPLLSEEEIQELLTTLHAADEELATIK